MQIENEDVNMPPAKKLMVSSHSDTIEGNAVRILENMYSHMISRIYHGTCSCSSASQT